MKAYERYLAVFSDKERKKLDIVPSFVQYVREEFISKYKEKLINKYEEHVFNIAYFDIPLILGFNSIFAPFPSSVKVKSIKIKNEANKTIRIGEDGQAKKQKTSYYEGGYINSIEILENLYNNLKRIDNSKLIKKTIKKYEKLSSLIFPVLTVDGIFDRVWKSMGMSYFSRHFRKRTKLYLNVIKYFSELLMIKIEGLINATGKKGRVVNILDDVAYKGRSMISPERWREDFLPYYRKVNAIISDAGMISQIHTDGDPTDIIPYFQMSGFQGLQGWEGGCDPFYINEHFPDFVVIGFGDVSYTLPFGTKKQIENHVKMLMDALKDNKHFIIGPSTVIYERIPLENVKIFISAVKKYGKY